MRASEMRWLIAEWVWTGKALLQGAAVAIQDEKVQEVVPKAWLSESSESLNSGGMPIWMLSPGLIDIQVNGFGGVDWTETLEPSSLLEMHQRALKFGVTSLLPTLVSSEFEVMTKAVEAFRKAQPKAPEGLLGLHFEGPYLNPLRKGIHRPQCIRGLSPSELEILRGWKDAIALMTLAPECVDYPSRQALLNEGLRLAIGHSEASFEQAMESFGQGISAVTHLFNAMPPMKGREPGILGALLASPQVMACLIADGHHVHPSHASWLRALPNRPLCLVTDALKSAGSSLKAFEFCGQSIQVKDGACQSLEGQLAGAHLTLNQGARNWMEWTGAPWHEALQLVTTHPARLLGLEGRLGCLQTGAVANLVAWKAPGEVQSVWFRGRPAFCEA